MCLCLLALTFVCNSTYLLKLEVQRYDSKQRDALKVLSHGAIFLATCNAILHSKKRCVNFCPNFNTPFGGFCNTPKGVLNTP